MSPILSVFTGLMTHKLSCSAFSMQVIGWTLGAIVIGALLYPLLMMARERKWCRFVGISPHEYKVTHCQSLACLDLRLSKTPRSLTGYQERLGSHLCSTRRCPYPPRSAQPGIGTSILADTVAFLAGGAAGGHPTEREHDQLCRSVRSVLRR